jgi:hypothetical protein
MQEPHREPWQFCVPIPLPHEHDLVEKFWHSAKPPTPKPLPAKPPKFGTPTSGPIVEHALTLSHSPA